MLQRIRDGLHTHKWLGFTLLGALALVFAAWGAYGIVNLNVADGNYAAKVAGQSISLEQAREAWTQQQAQWSQRFGGDLPAEFKQQLQNEVLENLVRQSLLSTHTQKLGYRVSDEQIHAALRSEPAFQVGGQYSPDQARARLAQAGISLAAFEADLRNGLQRAQLQRGIQGSDFVTPLELERLHALEDEQREVGYFTLIADKYSADAKVDDAAVRAYYDKNRSRFMTAESVRLAYAELRTDQLAVQQTVTDADLHAAYDKAKDRMNQAEKRHARHILIQTPGGKDDPGALKKAQDVLAEAKSGKDFAELARKYSQDTGSAAQGGDLGLAERSYFVAPFSDALFSMSPGEIRGPVKTQFGYHIIKLEEVQAGKTRSFEEARAELESQLRHDRAGDRLGDVQEQLARKLEEPGADFDALVKEFSLQPGEVPQFERVTGGAPLGTSKELQDVAFSAPVLDEKRIGGPVAMGEDRLVIVKAVEHRKPVAKPLADVREEIVTALRKEHGVAAAAKAADAARARLLSGASFEDVAREAGASAEAARFVGRDDPSTPGAIRTLVFEIPKPAGKPVFRTVKLDDGGTAVVAVTAVRLDPAGSTAERRASRSSEVASRHGAGDVAAYVEEVRHNAKVSKNPKAFE